jgi:hypothetical protein
MKLREVLDSDLDLFFAIQADRAAYELANRASVRVLEKNGFRLLREEPESLVFELR